MGDRRSIRLKGYDYSEPGAYFITICTQNRVCLFGEIKNGALILNNAGKMVQTIWDELPQFYPGITVDEFIVMPNHVHGIIFVGATPRGCPSGHGQAQGPAPTTLSLPDTVHRFKSMTTKRYGDGVKEKRWPAFGGRLWQRNYYEHIIRDEQSLNDIRTYIHYNPQNWETDENNLKATKTE